MTSSNPSYSSISKDSEVSVDTSETIVPPQYTSETIVPPQYTSETIVPPQYTSESTPLIPSLLSSGDIGSKFTANEFKEELIVIFWLTLPNVITFVISSLLPIWTNYSLGQLGSLELGAGAFTNTLCSLTGICFIFGMATALDTLCAQAYTGSEDKTVVGLYLQRGIIVCTLTFLPISVLWWKMGSILLLLGSDPALVALVDVYIKWRIVGVPPMIVFECLKKYLQAQGIVKAPSYIMILVTPFGIILNHYLVINPSTSIGFIGAPIAFVATTWLSMFVCILYIMFIDGKQAWGGFSTKALTGWWPIVKLGLGGMLMTSIEWWAFGSMALVVSSFGTVQLAAHSVLVSLDNLCYMPHLGVSISASIRVGNHLGARLPNRAKLAASCSYFLGFCSATMTSILLGGFAKFWANTFSNDPEVISLIVNLMPIVVVYQVFDSCSSVSGGILRGEGRQSLGAYILLIGFYAVAVPLGIYLSVATPLKLWGVWIGFVLGLVLCCSLYLYYFINTDWDAEVENTIKRLEEE